MIKYKKICNKANPNCIVLSCCNKMCDKVNNFKLCYRDIYNSIKIDNVCPACDSKECYYKLDENVLTMYCRVCTTRITFDILHDKYYMFDLGLDLDYVYHDGILKTDKIETFKHVSKYLKNL